MLKSVISLSCSQQPINMYVFRCTLLILNLHTNTSQTTKINIAKLCVLHLALSHTRAQFPVWSRFHSCGHRGSQCHVRSSRARLIIVDGNSWTNMIVSRVLMFRSDKEQLVFVTGYPFDQVLTIILNIIYLSLNSLFSLRHISKIKVSNINKSYIK